MPSTSTRKRHHHWTAFEHLALLCLICRQMQITGTSSPLRIRKAGHTKVIFDLAKSIKHAHHDVADALNRSLNYGNQANDIPVEEVSAMITKLMQQRKDAVGYLERQKISRVTRAMKRVWNRGARVHVAGCGRKDVGEGFANKESTVKTARGRKNLGKANAAAQMNTGGFASDSDDQGEFSI